MLTEQGASGEAAPAYGSEGEPVAFIDLDTVLIQTRQERRGVELAMRPGIPEGLGRLRQVVDALIVLVEPASTPTLPGLGDDDRISFLRSALGESADDLRLVSCPHRRGAGGEDAECDCRKPGGGLIEHGAALHQLSARHGWYIAGDQGGVLSGRATGLRTIRIGPHGEDPLSGIHRADYEARDLLDAANWMLVESLAHSDGFTA